MRPVPYLLKLPAAAARLPSASLQAIQRCNSSDVTVHWQQNLTALYGWVAERIDVDLMASGTVVHLQQPSALRHISVSEGETYSVLYMFYEMKREYRHCTAVMGAPLHMQGAQFCQRTCTCSSRCFSFWVTGSLRCQTRLTGCYSRAASWSKMAPSSAACRYTAVCAIECCVTAA
jgi:hypothetical protein